MEKIKDILIKPEVSIKEGLKQMDVSGKKVLFVIDEENLIHGVVTDGDIRRWILKNRGLSGRITKVMNKEPIVLRQGYTKEDAKEIMLSGGLECIPVVDGHKKVVSGVWWTELFDGKNRKDNTAIEIPVVIMAGGEGTRLAPFTNILPKILMPIGERPIIELIIDKFMEFGCNNFYLSLHHKASVVKAFFSDYKKECNIRYIQEDKPLGTIGSLYLLKDTIDSTFFVSNCDILIDADYVDIYKFHKDNKNAITLVVSVKHYTIPYGICDVGNNGFLKQIREKPEYDFLVSTGLYLMEPNVLEDIPENKFYNMTDLINNYIQSQKKISIYPVSERSWFDMGQFQELQNMIQRFGAR